MDKPGHAKDAGPEDGAVLGERGEDEMDVESEKEEGKPKAAGAFADALSSLNVLRPGAVPGSGPPRRPPRGQSQCEGVLVGGQGASFARRGGSQKLPAVRVLVRQAGCPRGACGAAGGRQRAPQRLSVFPVVRSRFLSKLILRAELTTVSVPSGLPSFSAFLCGIVCRALHWLISVGIGNHVSQI